MRETRSCMRPDLLITPNSKHLSVDEGLDKRSITKGTRLKERVLREASSSPMRYTCGLTRVKGLCTCTLYKAPEEEQPGVIQSPS
jgi:hypothetical protein